MFEISMTPHAPPAGGPYSKGIRAGDWIFCSGQVGMKADGTPCEGFEAQCRQTIENLRAVLQSLGADLSHVVNTRVFLQDVAFFKEMNAIYPDYFKAPYPTRTTVAVALPKPFLIEVDAVAYLGARRAPPAGDVPVP